MNRTLFIVLILVTTGLMGSSFTVGKFGLAYASPLFLTGVRFIMAGMIMAVIVKILKKPHPTKKTDWMWILLIGFLQTTCVMGALFMALRTISAGESSILTSMNPLIVIIFGTIFLKIRYQIHQWIGVLLGFVGVFIIMGGFINIKIGTLLASISALTWAISTLVIKTQGHKFDSWVMTAYQMLFGGIILFVISFLFEKPFFIINTSSIFILLWLVVGASIIQFSIWFYLLEKSNPERTSAFLFLTPFFAVAFGWFFLNEQLNGTFIFGGVLILVGIFLSNWKTTRQKEIELNQSSNAMVPVQAGREQ
ncbi:DMT family transporter [Sporosarcina sp. CAU 1771]